MKIIYVKIGDKKFNFKEKTNLIYSEENSRGKTTLLRAIIYGIGYQIPSTSGINLSKMRIVVCIKNEHGLIKFIRKDKNLEVIIEGGITENFLLPNDLIRSLSIFYNTDNYYLLCNLLGAIYFDQEKGWTLLNRGSVIGKVHFSIEGILQGIGGKDCSTEFEELSDISNKIETYKNIQNIIDLQKDDVTAKEINWDSIDSLKEELRTLDFKIRRVNNKIHSLKILEKQNDDFIDTIEKMYLRVRTESGEEVKVNKENIVGYDTNKLIINAKLASLYEDRKLLVKNKNKVIKHINSENRLFNINNEDMIKKFNEELQKINIDLSSETINNLIDEQKRKRKKVNEDIKSKLRETDKTQKLYDVFYEFADYLGVSHYLERKDKDYIFTKKVSNHSGAELHMLVFAMRLSILKVCNEEIFDELPLIIDSPSAGELDKNNLELMFGLLKKYFPKNQIIFASIFDSITVQNKIQINTHLLE